jgi:hypothetical protein
MSVLEKYAVCPTCNGEGYTSKLGAFTGDDMDEWFGDSPERDEFIDEYTTRGGIYDERCRQCDTRRVVLTCSEPDCENPREYISNPWGKGEEAKHCWNHVDEDEQSLLDMNAEVAAERAAGC